MRKPTCVYVPCFNEAGPHLERQLESFLNWGVKKVYYVDGPFPTFPHESDKSTDGSREFILSYPNTTIIDAGINYMPIKSNLALHRAGKDGYEALLVMGCDEYLEGDLNSIDVPDSPLGNIELVEHNPTGKYNRWEDMNPRLVCYTGLVRCVDVHWLWFFGNRLIEDHNMIPVEGIKIHCDDLARPRERDDMMTKYQDSNSMREREIMDKKYIWQICDMDFPPTLSKSGSRYYTCGCIIRVDGIRLFKCPRHINVAPKL